MSTPESVVCISVLNCLKSRWTDATEKLEQSSLKANYMMVLEVMNHCGPASFSHLPSRKEKV